jgi:hypothetical protein
MNAQASRKIIVVGAMAAVVAIGVTTFAMRPHSVSRMALAVTPPAPLAEIPVAENAVPTPPEAPATLAPVAPIVATPVTPAPKEVVGIKHLTVRSVDNTVSPAAKPAGVALDLSTTAAAAAVARDSEPVQGAAASTTATPPPTSLPIPAPAVATDQIPQGNVAQGNATPAASDSDITANVKSALAVESSGKYASIGVGTTNGVVALTGSLVSQDDIDHLKLVVAGIKDVKSVDTTALGVPAT